MATFAYGHVELKEQGEKLFKEMRVQRLREVREQEKRISAERCQQYRGKIDDHKRVKHDAAKEQKKRALMQAHDNLVVSWQQSLIDTGSAQRDAKENQVETINRISDRSSLAAEKMAKSLERQKQALQQMEAARLAKELAEKERAQRIAIRRELIASDREDAKAAAEARKAKAEAVERQQAQLALQEEEQAVLDHGNNNAAAQQNVPGAVVQARIMKHGAVRAEVGVATTVVSNKASVEENAVVKRLFKRCLDELRNKNKAAARARVARKSTAAVQNVEFLETELGLLLAYDRSPQRMYRIKNTTSIPPDDEGPVIVQTFEKMFLSDNLEKEHPESETSTAVSSEDTDDSEDDLPPEPERKSKEFAMRDSNSALVAKAEALEQKRREKVMPIRERVLVKTSASKKAAEKTKAPAPEAPPVEAIVVSIPAPVSSAEDGGYNVASSASWHPTPVWEKVGGVETGYGLEDSISSSSMLGSSGPFLLNEDEEEVLSDRDEEPRRASPLAQVSSQPTFGHASFNDSVDSLGLQSSALQNQLDDILSASGGGDEVEITRGSISVLSTLSPMRSFAEHSPLRMTLKDHSHTMSVAELRVSICSDSCYGENAAENNGGEVDASWCQQAPGYKPEVDLSRASTFCARHDAPLESTRSSLSRGSDKRSSREADDLHFFDETTLSASLEDPSFTSHDSLSDQEGLNEADVTANEQKSRDSSSFDSNKPPSNTRSFSESGQGASTFDLDVSHMAAPEQSVASRKSLATTLTASSKPQAPLDDDEEENSSKLASSFHSYSSSIASSTTEDKTASQHSYIDSLPVEGLKTFSFQSYVSSAASSIQSSLANINDAPSLTVRLTGADTSADFPTAQSVSFESLFIEESDDEDVEDGDDDDDDDDNDVVEEEGSAIEAGREPEEGYEFDEGFGGSLDVDSVTRSEEELERALIRLNANESRRTNAFDESRRTNGFDYTFVTANNNDGLDSRNDSILTRSSETMEMFTPHPFPPQSQLDGSLGTFSRRPFRMVPSPDSTKTAKVPPQALEASIDEESGPDLIDLLGLRSDQDYSQSLSQSQTHSLSQSQSFHDVYGTSLSPSSSSRGSGNSNSRASRTGLLELGIDTWDEASEDDDSPLSAHLLASRSRPLGETGDVYESKKSVGASYFSEGDADDDVESSRSIDSLYDDARDDNLSFDTKQRIETEIAEMRKRLLEAVQITAMSAVMSATRVQSASGGPGARGSPSSPTGSNSSAESPFFNFTADQTLSTAASGLETSSLSHALNGTSLSGGALSSQLMHESTGMTSLSMGQLSSQSSGGLLSGGNLSSLPMSASADSYSHSHLHHDHEQLWGSAQSDSSLSDGSANFERSILSAYSLNDV